MNTTTKKAANSIVGKLTAGILACAAALLTPAAAAQPAGDAILVIGDSLEVGSGPYLKQALTGLQVDLDAEIGRTSSQGLRVLAEELGPQHGTIVFPLGTNDIDPETLAANLAAAQQLAGGRCLVVATISRPRVRGSSAGPLNAVVERLAAQGAAQVMDWRSAVAAAPDVLGRDRVHATTQGYALRASMLAEAVQSCLAGADFGGIPAPRDPNARPPRQERAPQRSEPPPPAEPPARPVKLPALMATAALRSTLGRTVGLLADAGQAARTAAITSGPEPVLGSP